MVYILLPPTSYETLHTRLPSLLDLLVPDGRYSLLRTHCHHVVHCRLPCEAVIVTETALTWRMFDRMDGGTYPMCSAGYEYADEDTLLTLQFTGGELWHLLQIRTDARMRHLDRAQRDGLLADCGSPEGLHALLYAELKPDDPE